MGDSTWTHEGGFGFGSWGNTNFVGKDLRVTVPEGEEIPPGENWMFSIEVVAPPASFINNFDSFNKFWDAFVAQQACRTTNHQRPIVFSKTGVRLNRLEFIVIDTRTRY